MSEIKLKQSIRLDSIQKWQWKATSNIPRVYCFILFLR